MNKISSLLFIPVNEKYLKKINEVTSDAIIFDLEDSIPNNEKEKALFLLKQTIALIKNKKNMKFFVRVNKENALNEIKAFSSDKIDGFMLPKVEYIENIAVLKKDIKNKLVIALIETAKGVINIDKIASSELVDAIAFGAEDYTTSMNIKKESNYLLYPKTQIILHAKAYQKNVFDTPCFNISDEKILKQEIEESINLGFNGKLAIHPNQVKLINEMFKKTDSEYMIKIIKEYEKNNAAILNFNGKIYEKMHIERFKKLLGYKK